ncbi:MAG: hypothetical protein JXR49_19610 [Acidobacteria bacterium]|nr:hypothetical protein [Acidobacteriota bacterium]
MINTPDSNNLYLGAGSVFFDRFDVDGESRGFRHLGNVDTLEISTSVELKEKKNAMDGTKATYAEVPVGSSAEVSMAITEFVKENLALAMMGQDSELLQTANASVTDQPVGPAAAKVELDKWYDLECFNPTVSSVEQDTTTLDAQAYEVDAEAGMIRLLSSYTGADKAVAGVAIVWSGSIPEIAAGDNRWKVQAMTAGVIKGRLRYISAQNQSSGPRVMVDVWIVGLNPEGALGLITEDFGTFTLKGKVYADTSKPVGEQYYRMIDL